MSVLGPGPHARDQELEQTLLERFHRHGDRAARDELAERTLPIVHFVAARYTPRGEPDPDVIQAGCVGLLKAIDRFDLERGVQFSTFAIPNIAGEIRRHFRDGGWAVHMPRMLQEHSLKVTGQWEELTHRLQRPPSVPELAEATGLSTEQVLDALQAARQRSAVSLDAPTAAGTDPHEAIGGRDDGYDRVDDRLQAMDGLACLQPRERQIVALRFCHGLTQLEIAEHVGLSQMHVSRLLRQALQRMREHVGGDAEVLRAERG